MPRRPPVSAEAFTWTARRQPPPWAPEDPSIGWQPWEPISLKSEAYSAPAAVSRGVGMLDVFARGSKNELLWKTFKNDKWSPDEGFYRLDCVLTAAPAAVARGDGIIDVVVRGPDNQLYLKHFDGNIWGPTVAVGDYALQAGPGITSTAPDRLDTFHIGPRDDLAHVWTQAGLPWEFEDLYGEFGDAPAPYAFANGRAGVFLRGADGHLWRTWTDGQFWHEHRLSPQIIASPCVAATRYAAGGGPMRVDCIFRGVNGTLSDYWWDGDTAGIWDLPAKIGLDAPAAVNSGMGRVDVFSLDEQGALWHTWYQPPPTPVPIPVQMLAMPMPRPFAFSTQRLRLVFRPRRREYAAS
jgi:hypothetical protein